MMLIVRRARISRTLIGAILWLSLSCLWLLLSLDNILDGKGVLGFLMAAFAGALATYYCLELIRLRTTPYLLVENNALVLFSSPPEVIPWAGVERVQSNEKDEIELVLKKGGNRSIAMSEVFPDDRSALMDLAVQREAANAANNALQLDAAPRRR